MVEKKYPKEMTVTKDMVGLKMHVMNIAHGKEFNEYTVNVKFMELSDEGLDIFEATEDDCKA